VCLVAAAAGRGARSRAAALAFAGALASAAVPFPGVACFVKTTPLPVLPQPSPLRSTAQLAYPQPPAACGDPAADVPATLGTFMGTCTCLAPSYFDTPSGHLQEGEIWDAAVKSGSVGALIQQCEERAGGGGAGLALQMGRRNKAHSNIERTCAGIMLSALLHF
jgi:hypothetical protein